VSPAGYCVLCPECLLRVLSGGCCARGNECCLEAGDGHRAMCGLRGRRSALAAGMSLGTSTSTGTSTGISTSPRTLHAAPSTRHQVFR
jgi:hypothetical protein